MSMFGDMNFFNANGWVPFRNDSGEEVPPGAGVRVTGWETTEAGVSRAIGAKPNQYGSQFLMGINSPVAVPIAGKGMIQLGGSPMLAVYDSSGGSATAGERMGQRLMGAGQGYCWVPCAQCRQHRTRSGGGGA